MTTTYLRHNRVDLALHTLRVADGPPLLLLHGLGERAPDALPPWLAGWSGPVHALDFTGHGASTVPHGGGYSAELLMGDVDIALEAIGPATLLGRGLGAYIALLTAGARPGLVRGAILDDGPGLHGGPTGPTSSHVAIPHAGTGPPDPYALVELATDVRTGDYAVAFARHAVERSAVDPAISVTAQVRPAWLAAVVDQLLLAPTTMEAALERYAA